MYFIIVISPFLGFILSSLFGNHLGKRGAPFIATLSIFISFVISLVSFYEVGYGEVIAICNYIHGYQLIT